MRKAIIKLVVKGNRAGDYRFVLIGDNGESVAHSGTETYTQKHNAISCIKEYFPSFEIVDKTGEDRI